MSTKNSLIFVGIGTFWFLLFNIFLYPNIIAHYTTTSYYVNNILSIVALIVSILIILRVKREYLSNIKILVILNIVMILFLSLFLYIGRILAYIAAILTSFSLMIMYLDFYLLFFQMSTINFKWEKVKTISNLFAIGLVFYILFTVLHIFTINWAFIIAAFKGYGPVIVLIVCIFLVISIILTVKSKEVNEKNGQEVKMCFNHSNNLAINSFICHIWYRRISQRGCTKK